MSALSDFMKTLSPEDIFNNQTLILDILTMEHQCNKLYLEVQYKIGQAHVHPHLLQNARYNGQLQISKLQYEISKIDYESLIVNLQKEIELQKSKHRQNGHCTRCRKADCKNADCEIYYSENLQRCII